MTNADYFNASLQRLIDKCEQASFALAQNNIIPDLSSMNSEVEKICQAVQAADPPVARATEATMAKLIDSLEKLALALNAYKNNFNTQSQ